jgi:hypothetical protein
MNDCAIPIVFSGNLCPFDRQSEAWLWPCRLDLDVTPLTQLSILFFGYRFLRNSYLVELHSTLHVS